MTRARGAVLAALLAGFGLVLAAVQTHWTPVRRVDRRVAGDLHDIAIRHPALVTWWKWVSIVLHPDTLRVTAALTALVLLWTHRRTAAVLLAVALAGAAVLESAVKALVDRPRPMFAHPVAHVPGAGFPSGHAITATVAFGALVLLVPARQRVWAAPLAVLAVALVSLSRLALGVHYLTDVVGAWLLGAAWLVVVSLIGRCDWVGRGGRFRPRNHAAAPGTTHVGE